MESEPDAIECEHGNSATRPITTADATTTTITTTTNVDRPPSPHAPWKDIGNDSYSSEHESEALSASCTEPADNWLAAPAGAGETKGSKDGLPSAALYYPSRPRTITLLLFFVLVLVGSAFQRGAHHRGLESDIWEGLSVASFVLLTVGVLVFPTGPFTYPHPVVWRLLFGVSLLYLLALDFVLFQRYRYVRAIIASASTDPLIEEISNSTAAAFLSDEEDECALSFRSVWTKVDSSALHQTVCWMVKAIVVRDSSVLWVLNFLQALTETHVRTLLPPTANESGCSNSSSSSCCWWQSLALDPFVFNAVGIHAGMYVCKKLEMMELQWDEIISLKNTAARLKRAVLQFTPEAWSRIRWLDLDATHYKALRGRRGAPARGPTNGSERGFPPACLPTACSPLTRRRSHRPSISNWSPLSTAALPLHHGEVVRTPRESVLGVLCHRPERTGGPRQVREGGHERGTTKERCHPDGHGGAVERGCHSATGCLPAQGVCPGT
eukprot:Em0001g1822a